MMSVLVFKNARGARAFFKPDLWLSVERAALLGYSKSGSQVPSGLLVTMPTGWSLVTAYLCCFLCHHGRARGETMHQVVRPESGRASLLLLVTRSLWADIEALPDHNVCTVSCQTQSATHDQRCLCS